MCYLIVNKNDTVSIIYDINVYNSLPDEIKSLVIKVDSLPEKGTQEGIEYALMYNPETLTFYWQMIEYSPITII